MKKTTMADIARAAGVSKATVSMVLSKKDVSISEETKSKIYKIAKELSYIPNSVARSLSTNKSFTIGIIIPDITNPFFAEISRAVEDSANSRGYNVILCNTDNEIKKERKYIELLISKLVDGVIFISGGNSNRNIEIINNNNIPFVLVDRDIEGDRDDYGVYCSSDDGIKQAVQYLYSTGKRNIVFVEGPAELEISKIRLQDFKRITSEYGLYKKENIFESSFTIEGGMAAVKKIIEEVKDFDSIFFSNDLMAFGGIKALYRMGYRVPEDISVIGFDNIKISEFFEPELTTVSQPIYDMGMEACRLLIDVIDGKDIEEKQVYFNSKLVIRGTTK